MISISDALRGVRLNLSVTNIADEYFRHRLGAHDLLGTEWPFPSTLSYRWQARAGPMMQGRIRIWRMAAREFHGRAISLLTLRPPFVMLSVVVTF